jgi:hypothetical protein
MDVITTMNRTTRVTGAPPNPELCILVNSWHISEMMTINEEVEALGVQEKDEFCNAVD